jgi:two-component system, chemotaxis family, protein-glutamate methylesterase/glutaminase
MSFDIVVLGTSSGGLKALQYLLPRLPPGFQTPVVIVQHRGSNHDSGLCDYLAGYSQLPLSEPEDKEPIRDGHVYLAPRDYHLLIEDESFALSTEGPIAYARPSIDLLFESAAEAYRDRVIGMILTGANRDGALGLAKIKSQGGLTVVEDPEGATNSEMPRAALEACSVDWVLPLEEINPLLERLTEWMPQHYAC